jgi:hypothetical protein
MRLPDVLDTLDLPLAELCASKLDGELFGVGDGFRPVDYPDDIVARALSLSRTLTDGRIAHRETAAWILGATPVLVRPLPVCVHAGLSHGLDPRHGMVLGEAILRAHETFTVGGLEITTPMRTVIDLLRVPETAPFDATISARLLADADLSTAEVELELGDRRFQRERKRAFRRLRQIAPMVADQPADTL